MSKDSLIKGTLILTVAALVARFIGVFQKIPLVHLLDDTGMGSYGIAFNLYSSLLVVATAGIPSALSKLVAESTALGRQREADRIYRAAVWFSLASGFVMAVLLFALAPWYAESAGDPKAALATQAIAPAMLMFPLIAVMRGYFQGRRRMMPNGVSQVIEQVFRLAAAVGLAYALLHVGDVEAIAGASFGGVVGGAAALAVMVYYMLKLRREDRVAASEAGKGNEDGASAPLMPYRVIYAKLLRLSVPIVLYSVVVTLIYLIDSRLLHPLLSGTFELEQRRELLGILTGRAQSLAGIPIILAIALSQSIVPIISAAYSSGNLEQVRSQTSRVLQISLLSGLPAVLLIAIAARPIDGAIFGYEKTAYGYENAPYIIGLLTMGALFQILMQTSGGVLMGMGKMKALIVSVGIGIAIKLAGTYALAPFIGIYGLIVSTGLCFVAMTAFNLLVLRKEINFHVLGRKWIGLGLTTAVIVGLGIPLELWTHGAVKLFAYSRMNEIVNAVIVAGWTVAAYAIGLVLFRVVTKNDIDKLPKPLQKLIGKGQKLMGRAGA
ncbi:oligosaccharide flippase family protein [Paenibacillus chartarius]|uniref:Oligosaccharide flippase family protein n=1 Tax=Paenibacillus chartarius TaxID=747481 RepID=A0ABV6DN26_9BACL